MKPTFRGRAELLRENAALRALLLDEVRCQTCNGTGKMGGECEACAEGGGFPQCAICSGTGEWSDTCEECEGDGKSFRTEGAAVTPQRALRR